MHLCQWQNKTKNNIFSIFFFTHPVEWRAQNYGSLWELLWLLFTDKMHIRILKFQYTSQGNYFVTFLYVLFDDVHFIYDMTAETKSFYDDGIKLSVNFMKTPNKREWMRFFSMISVELGFWLGVFYWNESIEYHNWHYRRK